MADPPFDFALSRFYHQPGRRSHASLERANAAGVRLAGSANLRSRSGDAAHGLLRLTPEGCVSRGLFLCCQGLMPRRLGPLLLLLFLLVPGRAEAARVV